MAAKYKRFGNLSPKEILAVQNAAQDAIICKVKELAMVGGLSHVGVYSVYRAVQDAIVGEWEKAKKLHKIR